MPLLQAEEVLPSRDEEGRWVMGGIPVVPLQQPHWLSVSEGALQPEDSPCLAAQPS